MAYIPTSEDIVGAPITAEELRRLAETFDNGPIVTTKALAEALGITERRVLQLVDKGFLFKKDRNQFNLMECVHNFVKYKRRMELKNLLNLAE